MSESPIAADETSTLPIFPLAVVLVPGELLPLHIFEERYKAMVAAALDGDRRFGLSFSSRAEVGRDSVPAVGSVGCVAQISAVVPLDEGRMNILSVGAGRYTIRGYAQYEPFLVAEVETLADGPGDEAATAAAADEVRDLFARLVAAAKILGDAGEAVAARPEADPEELSFLVAANVALDNDVKQEMLESTDTLERLELLRRRLLELVDTHEYRAEMHARAKSNGHGKKVPEIEDEDDE